MKVAWLAAGLIAASVVVRADDPRDVNKRIQMSEIVFREFMASADHLIPKDLLVKAQCVGIVPSVKTVAAVAGGRYGVGIVTCRVPDIASTMPPPKPGAPVVQSYGWSAPATINVSGGSLGAQLGAGGTDVLFLVETPAGKEKLITDKFTFGVDASVIGPTGPKTKKQGFLNRGETVTWTRSRGLFAGVTVEGSTLTSDNDSNVAIYGKEVTMGQILNGYVAPPESAAGLYVELNRWMSPANLHQ
jgi:lipid-binding SYLF domain-containing protein